MKFLFFELKTVCYNSYIYFANSLAEEFKKTGHEVDFFRISEEPFEALEKYIDTTYDAIIDFNSDLPRAIMDDDSYFLDHINAPFFDIILDHPLYHHDSLKHKLNNFHVICLDENHKNYIEKYYPHIKSVTVCYMTGEMAFDKNNIEWDNWDSRPYDIMFSGSYTNPQLLEKSIHELPAPLEENIHNIIDILMDNPSKTIEDVVTTLSENEFYDYINADVALHTQSFYLADAYVRSENRRRVIKALDSCRHNLHLYGSFWDELELNNSIVHREMPFNLTFTLFNKAKISTNIMPNFKAGAHDRIFSSQLNGAVALTDPSLYLNNMYSDENDILFYSLNEISSLPDKVDYLLDNPDRLKKIAQNGCAIANANHTWTNVFNTVFKAIKSVN